MSPVLLALLMVLPCTVPASCVDEVDDAIASLEKAIKEKAKPDIKHFVSLLGDKYAGAKPEQKKTILKLDGQVLGMAEQELKDAAVEAVARTDAGGVPLLEKELDKKTTEETPSYMSAVVKAIGRLKDPKEGQSRLLKLLKHKTIDVVADATGALGNYKDAPFEAKKVIVEEILKIYGSVASAANEPRDSTAKAKLAKLAPAADETLRNLTGQNVKGYTDWQKWWNESGKKATKWPRSSRPRMTRALAIALFGAAMLAVIAVGFLVLQKPSPAKRRPVEAARRVEPAARVLVLAGQSGDRAVVLKPRYADPGQAEFTDRALAEKIGAEPGSWRFVEVWVVNRGADEVASLRVAPTVTASGASSTALQPLRGLSSAALDPAAAIHVRDLAPDSAVPLRKGSFRRTVYALASSVRFEQLVSAEVDGIALTPRETTEDALEAFLERPRPDLIAALSKPEDSPGSRARTDRMEESR